MFGASEDRARQLAGRQRWKRISSGGSTSSHRSVSSLSQLSQRDTSSIFEQNTQRPTTIPEHHAAGSIPRDLHDSGATQHISTSEVEKVLSQMLAEHQNSRTQQQRSQAEHLSQVLHSDRGINDVLPSTSHSVLPSLAKPYGVLGLGATLLQQLRCATAPTQTSSQPSIPSAHFTGDRSVSTGNLQDHLIASLRGGADDNIPTVFLLMAHACWDVPFNTGGAYRSFLQSLSTTHAWTFTTHFSDDLTLDSNISALHRRHFFQTMTPKDQDNFQAFIFERVRQLLGPDMDGAPYSIEQVEAIRGSSISGNHYPMVRLRYLMNATLPPEQWFAGPAQAPVGLFNAANLWSAAAR